MQRPIVSYVLAHRKVAQHASGKKHKKRAQAFLLAQRALAQRDTSATAAPPQSLALVPLRATAGSGRQMPLLGRRDEAGFTTPELVCEGMPLVRGRNESWIASSFLEGLSRQQRHYRVVAVDGPRLRPPGMSLPLRCGRRAAQSTV